MKEEKRFIFSLERDPMDGENILLKGLFSSVAQP